MKSARGKKTRINRKDIETALESIKEMTHQEERKSLLARSLDLDLKILTIDDSLEKFYIQCLNAGNMTDEIDIHLEKIYEDDISQYFDNFFFPESYNESYFSLLITNDRNILDKYKFAINYDEFVMLCGFDSYTKENITIDKKYIKPLNIDCFKYFIKVLVGQLISATMDIVSIDPVVDWDGTVYYSEVDTKFEGWMENKEFVFFKAPFRYKYHCDDKDVFQLENIKKANLKTLENILNINILKIGEGSDSGVNWESKKDFLIYYDKTSSKRLYIKPVFLEHLKLDSNITFNIKTKFTETHYIEYYVTGIENELYKKTISEIKRVLNIEHIELRAIHDNHRNSTSLLGHWDSKRKISIIIARDLAEKIQQNNYLLLDAEKELLLSDQGYYLKITITENIDGKTHCFEEYNFNNNRTYNEHKGSYAQDIEGVKR